MQEIVFIGMGANLGDPLAQLGAGVSGMKKIPGFELTAISSPYRTAPVGLKDQPVFVNAVARGMFKYEPLQLLDALLKLEKEQGRERIIRWGPRTLDLDILLFGDHRIDHPRLKVPHVEMHQRVFVLAPLMEIAPDLLIPGRNKTPAQLLDEMDPDERAEQSLEKIAWES
jgi:2-amino-4-hydroxy-6-hydroxymethyldihydropteridine diphosphokinase